MIAPHTLANFQSLTKLIASIINAPHTLANFQSLTKLIALIINRFQSYCRTIRPYKTKLFGHPLRTIIVLLIFYIACLFHTVHHLL